ncbi:MAG: leucine-rich repeat domain-containing protein, partial [Clostridiales bacterium]|nr:leucine-rich repeat domain-containing protein [Clostridiales bacterium]
MKRKKKGKLIALLLALALVVSALPSGIMTLAAETEGEVTATETDSETTETELDGSGMTEERTNDALSVESNVDVENTEEFADDLTEIADDDSQSAEDAERAEEEIEEAEEESDEPLVFETTQDGVTIRISGSAEALAGVDSVSITDISAERIKAYEDALADDDSIAAGKVIAVYDITLLDEEGNAVEPNGLVSVSITSETLQEYLDEGEDIQILHNMNTTVEAVNDDSIDNGTVSADALEVMDIESDEEGILDFTTDSFSEYPVMLTASASVASGNCGASGNEEYLTWELTENSDVLYRSGDTAGSYTFSNSGDESEKVTAYTLTISGSGDMADYTAETTPWGLALRKTVYGEGADNSLIADVDPYITQVEFADDCTITHIGDHAFRSTGISTIEIPISVNTIGDYALIRCANMTEITLEDGTNPTRQFYVTDSVLYESYTEDDTTGIVLRFYPAARTTEIFTIPNGVTALGPNSMQDAQFTSVTIPDSVRSIDSYAFANSSLTSVTLPDNVSFGTEAEINTEDPGVGVFANCRSLTAVNNFPDVEVIPSSLLSNCESLTDFTIPNTVTTISSGAFRGTRITSWTIPASVTTIGSTVFAADSATTESDDLIISLTFESNSSLSSVGTNLFARRAGYTVTFQSDSMSAYKIFTDAGYEASIDGKTLPTDSIFTYAWTTDSHGELSLKITGFVDGLNDSEKVTITIPDTVTEGVDEYNVTAIASSAFGFSSNNQTNTTNIIIGANIETIGDYAFQRTTTLEEIDFSNATKLTSIGKRAFYNASALKSVDLSACESLSSVGDQAFQYGKSNLTLTLPD